MTATQWFEAFASFSFQVAVLVLVCKLLERALVRPADRCSIWNVAFGCILILACAAVLLPRPRLAHPWSWFEPQTLVTISAAQVVLAQLLFSVWILGALGMLVSCIVRWRRLQQALCRCETLSQEQVSRLMGMADSDNSGRELPMVLISDDADGPFCSQFHRPLIVLPRFLLEGSQNDLRHVLVHELEHLNTSHPLQVFWQQMASIICWFHPAVWSASSRASLMREFVCDEAAARQGAESAAYLRTLLHIAERFEKKHNSAAIGFVRTPSEIALRARRLVELAKKPIAKHDAGKYRRKAAMCILLEMTCLLYLFCLPFDSLASTRSAWSPWPSWTAKSAHCFGWHLRDYEPFDWRVQPFEITHHERTRLNTTRSETNGGSLAN